MDAPVENSATDNDLVKDDGDGQQSHSQDPVELGLPNDEALQQQQQQPPQQHQDQENNGSGPDDHSAAASSSVTPHGTEVPAPKSFKQPILSYGESKRVLSVGHFPQPGSRLGPFFCLGRLGKGTFCSIHKCISLDPTISSNLVAAKIELGEFVNSGVLEGEATMLQHLNNSLPAKTVPRYFGLYKSDEASAIVMEYLPGEDMHYLREQGGRRRVSLKDSVYLTADVMLPLLREMHRAGVVHRDVKPSNCVRYSGKEFSMVDFGLSKSILVSRESPHADPDHPWPANPSQCLRKERPTADFRGTSMYASLRVHEARDYCRRDDMWSLLYVFCDLVSGGLPWMSYAATKDRETCRQLKERIYNQHDTKEMLMGEDYHVSKYKRDLAEEMGATELSPVAEPLALSKDAKKVQLLNEAFEHIGSLSYSDEPDYDLIQRCLHGFLEEPIVEEDSVVQEIDWTSLDEPSTNKTSPQLWKERVPTWELADAPIDLDEVLWSEAEAERAKTPLPTRSVYGATEDFSRLPIEWQYRIAQMETTAKSPDQVPPHVALRDFMQCALPLVYGTWDSSVYEWGENASNRDWYRREVYYKLISKCLNVASKFNNFTSRSCFYENDVASANPPKRRKIVWDLKELKPTSGDNMVAVARVMYALQAARKAEMKKGPAPLSNM